MSPRAADDLLVYTSHTEKDPDVVKHDGFASRPSRLIVTDPKVPVKPEKNFFYMRLVSQKGCKVVLTAMAKADADAHAQRVRDAADKAKVLAGALTVDWAHKAQRQAKQPTAFEEYAKRYLEEEEENAGL